MIHKKSSTFKRKFNGNYFPQPPTKGASEQCMKQRKNKLASVGLFIKKKCRMRAAINQSSKTIMTATKDLRFMPNLELSFRIAKKIRIIAGNVKYQK